MSSVVDAGFRVTAPGRSLTDPSWVALVLQFNLDPAAYADPSWLPAWAAQGGGEVRRALSIDLLREHGLGQAHDWAMDDPVARIFSIDTASLSLLAMAVGVASHRQSLRQVVAKPQLTFLHSSLGSVMEVLWLPSAETIEPALPPAPGWTQLGTEALRSALVAEGFRQLLRLVDPSDTARNAVSGRIKLCAPRQVQEARLPALSEGAAHKLIGILVNDMFPRWAPAWTWLF